MEDDDANQDEDDGAVGGDGDGDGDGDGGGLDSIDHSEQRTRVRLVECSTSASILHSRGVERGDCACVQTRVCVCVRACVRACVHESRYCKHGRRWCGALTSVQLAPHRGIACIDKSSTHEAPAKPCTHPKSCANDCRLPGILRL